MHIMIDLDQVRVNLRYNFCSSSNSEQDSYSQLPVNHGTVAGEKIVPTNLRYYWVPEIIRS